MTDHSGRWFDPDKATKFDESRTFDGRNMISDATGSQWDHEALYRTAGGDYVLNRWSQMQGHGESYALITREEGAAWLVRNGRADEAGHDLAPEVASLEIA